MVCTNLFHLGRGTSRRDGRKSQGRLRDGPLRNWFLLPSLHGIASHRLGETLSQLSTQMGRVRLGSAECEGRVLLLRRFSSSLRESNDHKRGAKQGSPPAAQEGRLSSAPLSAIPLSRKHPPLLAVRASVPGLTAPHLSPGALQALGNAPQSSGTSWSIEYHVFSWPRSATPTQMARYSADYGARRRLWM